MKSSSRSEEYMEAHKELSGLTQMIVRLRDLSKEPGDIFDKKSRSTALKFKKRTIELKKEIGTEAVLEIVNDVDPLPFGDNPPQEAEIVQEEEKGLELIQVQPFPEVSLPRGFSVIRTDPEIHLNFEKARQNAERILAKIQNRTIIDDKGQTDMVNEMAKCMDLLDLIKEFKKEYFGESRKKVVHTDDIFRSVVAPLEEVHAIGKQKVSEYDRRIIAEAAEKQRKIDEENRKAIEEYEKAKVEAVDQETGEVLSPLPERPELKRQAGTVSAKVKTGLGSTSTKEIQRYRVTDFALLSDRWKMTNEALLNEAAKRNALHLNEKGLEVWSETDTHIRRTKK